jgi:hypothetical protein
MRYLGFASLLAVAAPGCGAEQAASPPAPEQVVARPAGTPIDLPASSTDAAMVRLGTGTASATASAAPPAPAPAPAPAAAPAPSCQNVVASPGCLGDCSNTKRAADGWCDDCGAHCRGGTEAQCVQACKDNCNRQTGAAKTDACPDGNGWKGCLAACGGIKGCRNSWCDGNHPERDQCHAKVQSDFAACEDRCKHDIGCLPNGSNLPPLTADACRCCSKHMKKNGNAYTCDQP